MRIETVPDTIKKTPQAVQICPGCGSIDMGFEQREWGWLVQCTTCNLAWYQRPEPIVIPEDE